MALRTITCLLAFVAPFSFAKASPVYVVGAPTRPPIASDLHTTTGLFVSYGIVADAQSHVVAERLTIWDAVRARDVVWKDVGHNPVVGRTKTEERSANPRHLSRY